MDRESLTKESSSRQTGEDVSPVAVWKTRTVGRKNSQNKDSEMELFMAHWEGARKPWWVDY